MLLYRQIIMSNVEINIDNSINSVHVVVRYRVAMHINFLRDQTGVARNGQGGMKGYIKQYRYCLAWTSIFLTGQAYRIARPSLANVLALLLIATSNVSRRLPIYAQIYVDIDRYTIQYCSVWVKCVIQSTTPPNTTREGCYHDIYLCNHAIVHILFLCYS